MVVDTVDSEWTLGKCSQASLISALNAESIQSHWRAAALGAQTVNPASNDCDVWLLGQSEGWIYLWWCITLFLVWSSSSGGTHNMMWSIQCVTLPCAMDQWCLDLSRLALSLAAGSITSGLVSLFPSFHPLEMMSMCWLWEDAMEINKRTLHFQRQTRTKCPSPVIVIFRENQGCILSDDRIPAYSIHSSDLVSAVCWLYSFWVYRNYMKYAYSSNMNCPDSFQPQLFLPRRNSSARHPRSTELLNVPAVSHALTHASPFVGCQEQRLAPDRAIFCPTIAASF